MFLHENAKKTLLEQKIKAKIEKVKRYGSNEIVKKSITLLCLTLPEAKDLYILLLHQSARGYQHRGNEGTQRRAGVSVITGSIIKLGTRRKLAERR